VSRKGEITMKRLSIALIAAFALSAGSAWAKLPPPAPLTEEAKVAAEEKKAKAAEAAKKDNENLAKSQDRVAEKYIKEQKAKGVVVKPTPIVPPAPPAAAPAVAPAPAPAVAAPAAPAVKK
jgi:hypothetical protein